jgi:hypothetical protein
MHADVDGLFGAHFLTVSAKHATEFVDLVNEGVAVPVFVCSSVSMRCVPRQREDNSHVSSDFCSGYCIVTLFRNTWLNVNPMPFRVARR